MATQSRRQALQALGALALAAQAPARADDIRRYAVISLVGDQIDVVYAQPVTGSTLDRNVHRVVADAAGSFDKLALAAVARAIEKAEPGAQATLLGVGPSPLHAKGETLVDGGSIGLPGSLVGAIEQSHVDRVVLLTKYRGEARVPLLDTTLGIGYLSGLGYYIDRNPNIRIVETGASGAGLLAAYAYLRLTLAESTSGKILGQRTVKAAHAYPVAASTTAVDPWEVLDNKEKIERLRRLLEAQIAKEVPLLLQGS